MGCLIFSVCCFISSKVGCVIPSLNCGCSMLVADFFLSCLVLILSILSSFLTFVWWASGLCIHTVFKGHTRLVLTFGIPFIMRRLIARHVCQARKLLIKKKHGHFSMIVPTHAQPMGRGVKLGLWSCHSNPIIVSILKQCIFKFIRCHKFVRTPPIM